MSKIKKNNKNITIKPQPHTKKSITVSFLYFTKNSNYNFDKLDKNEKILFKSELLSRIIEITHEEWIYWYQQPKGTGIETIYSDELYFSPNGYTFSKDEKVIIFRFYNQKGRIIGFKDSTDTFYIIGIDCKFNAYEH